MANFLPLHKKIMVLSALVEGNSVCSIVRMTGVNKRTILRLFCEAGKLAAEILDRELVNLSCRFVQVDEIWTFVGKKQRTCTEEEKSGGILGDQYVFVAMDSETKLVILHRVGRRTGETALSFLRDLDARISTRFQLSTDAFSAYTDAVDRVWGTEIDYGQVHKSYASSIEPQHRYSPPQVVSTYLNMIVGNPIKKRISTSHIERQNLTMRMQMRRFTRLTNAYSKKLENLQAAVALHFFHYNFMRLHQTLRVTPSMAAGVTRHVWTWENLLGLKAERKAA